MKNINWKFIRVVIFLILLCLIVDLFHVMTIPVGFVAVVGNVPLVVEKDLLKWITINVKYVKGVVYVLIAKEREK